MILQACPRCHRQYDVTHLELKSRVRCLCDEVLVVKRPRKLTVRALRCSNCGGAVSSEDPDCSYCHASLADLKQAGSLICPACYARMPEDARHCPACAIRIEPQALSPLPEKKKCPRCKNQLQVRFLGRTSVVECAVCAGMWLRPQVFADACFQAVTELPASLSTCSTPERAVPDTRVTYIPCLACRDMMFRRNYRHAGMPSGVIIDACREHGVWLDKNELEQILRFIRTSRARPRFETQSTERAPVLLPGPLIQEERQGSRLLQGLAFLGALLFELTF